MCNERFNAASDTSEVINQEQDLALEGGGVNILCCHLQGMAAAGTLRKLKIFELRKYLRANGLNISGKKDDLIQRVEEHLGKAKRR